MDNQEQVACTNWLISIMAEEAGLGVMVAGHDPIEGINLKDGESIGYPADEWEPVITKHLGTKLSNRIARLLLRTGNYWEAWPELTDAELGVIMKAGADAYL